MTIGSKPAKQKRRNKNQHYRATLIPNVRKLIEFLRNSWAVMGAVERGQRINKLVSVGCSKRGLGKDLGIPETNIRRHAEIAGLPESDRKAIDSGQSAKEILIAMKTTALQREMRRRIDQDARTGALSDEIAGIILESCRTGYRLRKRPIIKAMLPSFLDNVGSHLRKFEQTDHRPLKAPTKLEPRELFQKTRPRARKNTPDMVYQAEWLAEALWLIAPESPIRASALSKARKRAGELLPKRTPSESFEDECLVDSAKSIERSDLSRRVNPGGARLMPRQGRISPPMDSEDAGNSDSGHD
jgi:hypothetical protein